MKAVVTGASGFLGSHLVKSLLKAGESVAVLCRPNSNLWRIEAMLSDVTLIRGDFTALSSAKQAIQDFRPEAVFHLAWFGVGGRYRDDPRQIDLNLTGSIALMRLALVIGCQAFVGLGSQAEYGVQNRRLNERAPTEPINAYGVAKLSTYLILKYLASSHMRFIWLRLFSAYGPKEGPEWMIPYVVNSLMSRK